MSNYNDYENLDPYFTYGSGDDTSPYAMLNQMKSWTKGVTIQVTSLKEDTQARFDVMDDRITAEILDVNQNMTTAINVLNGEINLKVDKGGSIADINIDPKAIKIRAEKVELSGYATFTSLSQPGATSIHGANIVTGTILADKIAANQIRTQHIYAGAITASELAIDAVYAGAIQSNAVQAYNIASYAIQANHIQAGAITAGAIQADSIQSYHIRAYAIQANHIQAGTISAQHIVAGGITADVINGGTINSSTINVSTNATIGKVLNIGTHYADMDGRMIRFGGGTGGVIGYSYDQITIGAANGVRTTGALYVGNGYGNIALADTQELSFGVSTATSPPRLYVRIAGSNVGTYIPING